HSTSLRAASNRGLVRGPELPPDVHRSFASLRMTRERENETPFAQNATLLRISTSRKRRETLRLRSGQAPSTPIRAGSFDSDQGRLLRLRSQQAMRQALAPRALKPPHALSFDGTTKVVPSRQREIIHLCSEQLQIVALSDAPSSHPKY